MNLNEFQHHHSLPDNEDPMTLILALNATHGLLCLEVLTQEEPPHDQLKEYLKTILINISEIARVSGLYLDKLDIINPILNEFYSGKSNDEILCVLSYTIGSVSTKVLLEGMNQELYPELQNIMAGIKALIFNLNDDTTLNQILELEIND